MAEFSNVEEFERFERKWIFVFTCFGTVFAGALLDYMFRSPRGEEAVWCYSLGAFAFVTCVWAGYKLRYAPRHEVRAQPTFRDGARDEGAMGWLDLLGDDLSIGDFDD